MPRSNGTYTPPAGSTATSGQPISSSAHNALLTDLSTALTQSIATDGSSTITGSLAMAGNKLTGLGAPTNPNDSARLIDVQSIPVGSAVRNTVVIGDNANGTPAFLTTGSGLTPSFTATNLPLVITFANGFTNQGASDFVSALTGGASLVAIAASCISYIAATYVDASNVTWSATKAPPQYGATYNKAAQSCMKLASNALDDFGNAWTNNGVTFDGTYGSFNGSSGYLFCPDINTLYPQNSGGGWSLRAKVTPSAIGASRSIASFTNVANYGAILWLDASGKIMPYLSSNGSSWDIANGTIGGSATLAAGTEYLVEMCFDPVAAKYYVYVNGALDQTINSSARICGGLRAIVGAHYNASAFVNFFQGKIRGFEFLPYCDHPAGTTYSVPASPPGVTATGYASDWFDTIAQQMKSVSAASGASGSNPAFTTSKKVYVGEAQAGASSVSSVTAYAFNQTGKNGAGLLNAFGYGQTSKTTSDGSLPAMSLNTTYFNDTPKPQEWNLYVTSTSGAGTVWAYVDGVIRGISYAGAGVVPAAITFTVPPGSSFKAPYSGFTPGVVTFSRLG